MRQANHSRTADLHDAALEREADSAGSGERIFNAHPGRFVGAYLAPSDTLSLSAAYIRENKVMADYVLPDRESGNLCGELRASRKETGEKIAQETVPEKRERQAKLLFVNEAIPEVKQGVFHCLGERQPAPPKKQKRVAARAVLKKAGAPQIVNRRSGINNNA